MALRQGGECDSRDMKWIRKPDTETRKKFGMAAAVAATLLAGLLVFYRHWQFELPFYPNVDEQLSLDCIYNLLNQHLYAGDIYILDFSGIRILRSIMRCWGYGSWAGFFPAWIRWC